MLFFKYHCLLCVSTGDSIYAKDNTLAGLETAFKNLSRNPLYDNFKKSVKVDGIWDDHDMGINDGGKYVKNLKERQAMFMKFVTDDHRSVNAFDRNETRTISGEENLNTSPAAVSDADGVNREGEEDRGRDHLSKVFDKKFGTNGPNVRFILLDTRSQRDYHYIRSLGEIKFPLTPIVAAFLRGAYSVMGLGREHQGDTILCVLLSMPSSRRMLSVCAYPECCRKYRDDSLL